MSARTCSRRCGNGSITSVHGAIARLKEELGPERPYLCILRSWLLHPRKEDDRALRDGALAKEPILLDWVRPWLHPWEGAEWPPGPV